jgi:energy-coupling factor transport system permease protein
MNYLEGGTSIFHRMDVLSKFAWVFLVPAIAYASNDLRIQFANIVLILLVGFILARMPFGRLIKASGWLVALAAALFFFHNVINPKGDLVYQLGFIRLYSESLANGTSFALRVIIIGLTGFIFVLTTSPRQLVIGLVHIKIPYRLAWGVLLALRYIPIIGAELDQIREAQLVRGVRRGGGLAGYLEMYQRYTLPLLASVLRMAEDSALAMDGRGFGAYPDRVFVDEFHWTRSGIALLVGSFLLLILVLTSQVVHLF